MEKNKNEIDYLSHLQDLKVFELKAPMITLKDLRRAYNKGRIGCSETKKRPILFSGPMVKAILDGKKTMTRRIYKPRFDSWKVGDKLWVKETYLVARDEHSLNTKIIYAATDPNLMGIGFNYYVKCSSKTQLPLWRPSIFMPRKYSRILLEITDIKREALRDISEADAKREGFDDRQEFLDYFEKINPEMKGKNPEVVAIGFKVLELKKTDRT